MKILNSANKYNDNVHTMHTNARTRARTHTRTNTRTHKHTHTKGGHSKAVPPLRPGEPPPPPALSASPCEGGAGGSAQTA